ncbi:hypothetical protein OS145_05160 [Idiomarina baltica OS145]|uniref:Uncharacterized protein n=1 Tax=Idiomarina baltica OS145 TaxID=314276 RepID=A0ABM9WL07_9GAMM|nr:hypothetical protein OS145_05160 [Idiomarina baltica OS145]
MRWHTLFLLFTAHNIEQVEYLSRADTRYSDHYLMSSNVL